MFSLFDGLELPVDYSTSKVLVPLSAGINSAAVLCFLGEHHPERFKPKELHLYYAHLIEHSPDSLPFVEALIKYAQSKFLNVKVHIITASVNEYFIQQKMIPHPTISPCSKDLKIIPMQKYDAEHEIDVVLIGFVKHEFKRFLKAQKRAVLTSRTKDVYPILSWTDEDCFEIIEQVIGWYPKIYKIRWTQEDWLAGICRRQDVGKRVFAHNNCLPCKNMTARQIQMVGRHFPAYAANAQATADAIPGAYWGRDDVPDVFKCDACDRM